MKLGSRARQVALSVHIAASVGWLGAVLVFLVLAVIALRSGDPLTVRGAYLVMDPAARYTLVPFALVSLASGLAVSLGGGWGLLQHYWVLVKLAITVVWTVVLLAYLPTFAALAARAEDPTAPLAEVADPSPALHAGAALLGLVAALALSVVKPRGMTPYGQKRRANREPARDRARL